MFSVNYYHWKHFTNQDSSKPPNFNQNSSQPKGYRQVEFIELSRRSRTDCDIEDKKVSVSIGRKLINLIAYFENNLFGTSIEMYYEKVGNVFPYHHPWIL